MTILFALGVGYVYTYTIDPFLSGGAVGPYRQDPLQRRQDLLVCGGVTVSGHGHHEGLDADGSPQLLFDVGQQDGVAPRSVQPQVDQRLFDVLSKFVVHNGGVQ